MTPIRYLPTPNTMDMLPPHAGLAGLRAAGLGGFANLRDEAGPEGGIRLLPTPTASLGDSRGPQPPARRQAKRLEAVRRALTVMREPNDPGAIMLLCGDLNARPGEPCIRLLSGESVEPEYWTEAQDTAVLLGRAGHALATTLDGSHPMAAHTARLVGADPGRIPARRIDYMFSEGWNHGRRGGWTGDVSLTDTGWSDHMLMEASILV